MEKKYNKKVGDKVMNFEKLNETNCRVDDIKNNDKILIGGSFFGKFDLKVCADTDNFEKFFVTVEKNALNFANNKKMEKWLHTYAPEFDTKLFAHMFAFDNVLRKIYPNMSSNISQRQNFYDAKGSKTLSQAFDAGICKCAEISILAQAYFQRQGINTKYFGGELLRSSNEEFGEAHSFITVNTDQEEYIYDPANPILSSGAYMPRISTLEVTPAQRQQFENKIHTQDNKRNCAFMEAKDILTQSNWYYGCGDGANIFPSFLISKNTKPQTIPQTHGR